MCMSVQTYTSVSAIDIYVHQCRYRRTCLCLLLTYMYMNVDTLVYVCVCTCVCIEIYVMYVDTDIHVTDMYVHSYSCICNSMAWTTSYGISLTEYSAHMIYVKSHVISVYLMHAIVYAIQLHAWRGIYKHKCKINKPISRSRVKRQRCKEKEKKHHMCKYPSMNQLNVTRETGSGMCMIVLIEYRALLIEYRDLLIECRAILIEYRALLTEYRALLIEYRALLIEYRALLIEYRALLIEYRALLIEYRALWIGMCMTVFNENATSPKCTNSTKSDPKVSRVTSSIEILV